MVICKSLKGVTDFAGEKNIRANTRLWERKGAVTAEVTSVSGYFFCEQTWVLSD